ncbi:MAG TPA: hypothetical protein VJR06_01750, partial [Nitrososphaerales archaeon]|nr:hypothetical protein [Nitrososphaerales archaeon]
MSFTSPSSAGTYYYCATVTDSVSGAASSSASGSSLTVNGALSAGVISPGSPAIDPTQSVLLTANPTGGTPGYTYQWYTSSDCSTTAVSGATSQTYSASPSSTTTFYVKVTDSVGFTSCSGGDTVTVNPALFPGSISPSSPTIDSGQSVGLTANPTGGSGSYSYQWYTSSDCSTSPISGATSRIYSASSAGTYYVKVTDSLSATVCSLGDTVTVDSALSARPITSPNPTIDNGQSLLLTSHPSGGTGTFTYQWYIAASPGTCNSGDTLISGATSSIYDVTTPTAYDPYYACYIVTDTGVTSGSSPAPTAGSSTYLVTIDSALAAGA